MKRKKYTNIAKDTYDWFVYYANRSVATGDELTTAYALYLYFRAVHGSEYD